VSLMGEIMGYAFFWIFCLFAIFPVFIYHMSNDEEGDKDE
jgi:hypothetical protein